MSTMSSTGKNDMDEVSKRIRGAMRERGRRRRSEDVDVVDVDVVEGGWEMADAEEEEEEEGMTTDGVRGNEIDEAEAIEDRKYV